MKIAEQPGRMARWLAATLAVVAATAALAIPGVSATTAACIYLTLVVWFATLAGYRLSLYVALASAAAFDFFFLLPLHTFWLVGVQQWVAMASFVASSAVVSRVAELARQQKLKAEQRRADVERLYALSQQMMLFEDPEQLLHALPGVLVNVFALDDAALYVAENEGFYASAQALPMGLRASLQAAGDRPGIALQAGEFALMPLMLGLRPVGGLAWRPGKLHHDAATAVCAQVAIAVARSMATEETARLEAAREAERLRAALTDSLTHELRTPLTSIRAAASTLRTGEGLDAEVIRELAAIIDEESARLDQLIGEAVEMAELDSQSVKVEPAPHLVRSLLEQAAEAAMKKLEGHPVTIEIEGEDRLAWFDAHLLGRVLGHLLENAAAYTPVGTRVRLTSRRSEGKLEFAVEDNGPGIEPRDLGHIFDRFYRGRQRTAVRKGSGMGLAIVRAILTAHGGSIQAASEPGRGASFRFWVPLEEREPQR